MPNGETIMLQNQQSASSIVSKIMAEKRSTARVRSTFSGVVLSDNEFISHCVIKDVSETGMRIELADRTSLPDNFEIKTPVLPDTLPVRLIWQKQTLAGIEFVIESDASSEDELQAAAG